MTKLNTSAIEKLSTYELVEAEYPNQNPRQAQIWLTIDEDGDVGTDVRCQLDGIPADWYGKTRALRLPMQVDAAQLASWVQANADALTCEDEQDAEYFAGNNAPRHDGGLYDAGGWFADYDHGVTFRTTDHQLAVLATELRLLALDDGVVLDGLDAWLEDIRTEMIEEQNEELEPETYEKQYIESWAGNADSRLEFENQSLSVGVEFLPPCALAVYNGESGTEEYWAWLLEQKEAMDAEGLCDGCGKWVRQTKKTTSRLGYCFCNYECMGNFYNDEIPEDEEFKAVAS